MLPFLYTLLLFYVLIHPPYAIYSILNNSHKFISVWKEVNDRWMLQCSISSEKAG